MKDHEVVNIAQKLRKYPPSEIIRVWLSGPHWEGLMGIITRYVDIDKSKTIAEIATQPEVLNLFRFRFNIINALRKREYVHEVYKELAEHGTSYEDTIRELSPHELHALVDMGYLIDTFGYEDLRSIIDPEELSRLPYETLMHLIRRSTLNSKAVELARERAEKWKTNEKINNNFVKGYN